MSIADSMPKPQPTRIRLRLLRLLFQHDALIEIDAEAWDGDIAIFPELDDPCAWSAADRVSGASLARYYATAGDCYTTARARFDAAGPRAIADARAKYIGLGGGEVL